jgi:1,4-alpha-glucan branching enzyme
MNTITRSFDKSLIDNLDLLAQAKHHDPHLFLGLHTTQDGDKLIRLWRPGAETLLLMVLGKVQQAVRIHEKGLFELHVPECLKAQDYQIYHQNGLLANDPYSFYPTLGEVDLYLFGKGSHYELYNVMGGRITTQQGVVGTKFAVWAPSANSVALVGDFNYWDGRVNPMRCLGHSGIWELFIPGLTEGQKYKFEIKTQAGELLIKSDPFALSSELRPATASVVANIDKFEWEDQNWIHNRILQRNTPQPFNIYEVHLGSWKKNHNEFLNYREIAQNLVNYCSEMGYTHVELMPIQEHPLDESWGYQVTGFYAITSRFGTPEDFQWFVNHLHKNNIGIILDWVPGHFPTDSFSLAKFDGTSIYEHEDPRQGFHPHWNTLIFNFGRHEVANFLIANAFYWFDKMHIDGLRVDAVASMLYLDYGRENGEWIPNIYGGKENLEAIEFFKHLNSIIPQRFPGVLMIAEESTSFLGVTHPVEYGGLGFNMKWNMGWMNDILYYFSKDPIYRCHHHNELTFGLLYAFSEKFALVLSHDEVVHGKNSLMGKMPGDIWQKFANQRLLLSFMICQPGKKLLFMGGEIGQWNEWNCKRELEWDLLQFSTHKSLQVMVKELNHFYKNTNALWEKDFIHEGFEWVDFADRQNSVISYLRKGMHSQVLCVHNFTPNFHQEYVINLPNIRLIKEVFNSDSERFGGSGKINYQISILKDSCGHSYAVRIQLAPLATMIFAIEY